MNKLDLAKVGKAFGFAVPPRVNIAMAGERPTNEVDEDEEEDQKRSKGKRRRAAHDEVEADAEGQPEGGEANSKRQRNNKKKRMEQLGKKRVEREVFKKGRERRAQKANGQQWSR